MELPQIYRPSPRLNRSPAVLTHQLRRRVAGNVTDLVLGSSSDTLSSPFVDYADDSAYVGNDAGQLFRIKFVFCTTSACTGAGSPQPTLDNTWGSSGALTTGCPGK